MEAFITLASTDDYALGALVWANSLKEVGTTKRIVVMITRTISDNMKQVLEQEFDEVVLVDVLDSRDVMNLDLLTRPDLGVTFTKFHCWRLTQYTKGVFMDADTLAIQNMDDIFNYEEFTAAPDPGWPDCFNSGVFVFRPSLETYSRLLEFAVNERSFDGGDQGLLNLFFSDWATKDISKHLPFVYNCVSQAFYSYLPSITHFRSKVRAVHFIGPVKPWHHAPDVRTGRVTPQAGTGFLAEYLQRWWDVFFSRVQKHLTTHLEGLAAHLSKLEIRGGASHDMGDVSERDRQYMWERGEIDYTGRDRFDHIMTKIQKSIDSPASPPAKEGSKSPSPPTSSQDKKEKDKA